MALVAAVSLGCDPGDDARAQWLRDALIADHLDLLRRDPDQVAAKWAAMTEIPFQYLRGGAGVWSRDATLPGGLANLPTELGDPALARVLLVGDPHPENFGTYLPVDGVQTFDVNDFDAARVGPAHLDLRRLALGFAVALDEIDHDLASAAAEAVARGWRAGLDGAPRVTPGAVPGHFISELFDKAARKGRERDELLSQTVVGPDGRRVLVRHSAPQPSADVEEALDVEPWLLPQLSDGLAAWAATNGAPPVIDVVRVVGAGVGTRAHLRFRALLEDARMVEIKEARDPFVVHGLTLPMPRPFASNGARIAAIEEALHAVAGADPLLGHFQIGALPFVVHTESGWHKTLRTHAFRDELGAHAASHRDVVELARRCGEVLGAAHARGAPALRALAAGLPGDMVADDTLAFLDAYLPIALDDHARLVALRARHGPLLGWSP